MKRNLALLIFLVFAISCSDKPKSGPAEIYYGEDICERCKMIISEREFAAQYRLSNGETVKFDDIGCMIHYKKEHDKEHISSLYVVDFDSKDWIDGRDAHYVWNEKLITPMGYGIIAYKGNRITNEDTSQESGKYLGSLENTSEWVLKDMKNNKE